MMLLCGLVPSARGKLVARRTPTAATSASIHVLAARQRQPIVRSAAASRGCRRDSDSTLRPREVQFRKFPFTRQGCDVIGVHALLESAIVFGETDGAIARLPVVRAAGLIAVRKTDAVRAAIRVVAHFCLLPLFPRRGYRLSDVPIMSQCHRMSTTVRRLDYMRGKV